MFSLEKTLVLSDFRVFHRIVLRHSYSFYLINVFEYIDRLDDDSNMHHAFRGVKGAEFDRVIAIGGNNYALRRKTNFDLFFENWSEDGSSIDLLDDKDSAKYIEARNLLYVAATRARREFVFIYRGNIERLKDNIEAIFGEVKELKKDN